MCYGTCTQSPLATCPAFIEEQEQPEIIINATRPLALGLSALMAGHHATLSLPSRLRRGGFRAVVVPPTVRQASLADVERLVEFYATATEDVRRGADSLRRSVTGGRRTFLMEQDGVVTACARACVVTREPLVDDVLDRLGFEDVCLWQIIHMKR